MNNHSRIDQVDQAIEDALVALTRAVCLLGISEGKAIVQNAHLMVAESRRSLYQHEMAPPGVTRPQVSAEWAASTAGGRVLADLGLLDELPRYFRPPERTAHPTCAAAVGARRSSGTDHRDPNGG